MRPKNKPPSGFKPMRSRAPCHSHWAESHFSAKVTIFHLHWIKSPWMAKFKCWSLQRIFKLFFLSPTSFPSSQETFPSQKPGLAPGKACHWFSQKNQITSPSIHHFTECVIGCRRGEPAGSLRTQVWAWKWVNMSKYICSLCLFFLFFLQGKRENQTGLHKEGQVLSSDSFLASASWHLLWHIHTVTCPGTACPGEGVSSYDDN